MASKQTQRLHMEWKHQMVKLVKEKDLRPMRKQLEMEKKNAYACLNPFITPEEERIAFNARAKTELRPDQLLWRLRKQKIEATQMAPTYAEDNIKHMVHSVSWEK